MKKLTLLLLLCLTCGLRHSSDLVRVLEVSPEGGVFVGGGTPTLFRSNALTVWDLKEQGVVSRMPAPRQVLDIAIDSKNSRFFAGGEFPSILLHSYKTGATEKFLVLADKHVYALELDSVRDLLFVGGIDLTNDSAFILVLQARTGETVTTLFPVEPGLSILSTLELTDDGKQLMGVTPTEIVMWSLPDFKRTSIQKRTSSVLDKAIVTADGSFIISGELYGHVRVIDRKNRQVAREFRPHNGPILSVARLRDGSGFVTAGQDGKLCLWSLPGYEYGGGYRVPGEEAATQVSSMPDSAAVLVGDTGGAISIVSKPQFSKAVSCSGR